MKKNLIYTICFGDSLYKMMSQFLCMSIVQNTNFTDDIIILSDSEHITRDMPVVAPGVRIINIYDKFPELRERIKDRFNIFCIKPLISQIIDIKDYGYILYLDSDILIKYQHLNELLDFWASCGKIQVSSNGKWDVSRNVPNTGAEILSKEEKNKHASFGVCAGIVGFPGNELGLDFCQSWWEYNIAGNLIKDDQGNLTALIIRKYLDKFKYIDFINNRRTKLENITHYHTNKKCWFWEHVKFLLRKYETKPYNHLGIWSMEKAIEGVRNKWEFTDTMVFVDDPQMTGQLQHTSLGTFVWWQSIEGLERVKFSNAEKIIGDSFKGGEGCFTLTRL